MVDNLLPEHVELPNVLDLAVHLVQLMTWMGREVHFTSSLEHSFILKSYWWGGVETCSRPCGDVQSAMWWGGVVAYGIIVSPLVPLDFGFFTSLGLGLGLGQGGQGLGLGLDNYVKYC